MSGFDPENPVHKSAHQHVGGRIGLGSWLPDMDLNHDKQIQSLLCYRYTIRQFGGGQGTSLWPSVKEGQP